MAIPIQGNSGVVAEVDGTTFRAMRVTQRPVDYGALGYYRLGMTSGTIGASLAATGEVFQFRWPDATRLCVVYKVKVAATAVVMPAALVTMGLQLIVARAWTAAGTGGTRAVLTGNVGKMRTSMGTSLVNDAGIASTAALTAGTKTLDIVAAPNQNVGSVEVNSGNIAATAQPAFLIPPTDLLNADSEGQTPLVLAQNEGFVIMPNNAAWPATLTWRLTVNVTWVEAAAF